MKISKIEENKVLDEILEALNYHNEKDVVLDLAILSASTKYAEFSEECQRFEQKYGIEYNEFEEKISHKEYKEDFEEEDSLMAWKFAKDGFDFWSKRLEELKRAL